MRVYAEWKTTTTAVYVGEDCLIHISCGFGDEQWDCFDMHDDGAVLSCRESKEKDNGNTEIIVRLEVPVNSDTQREILKRYIEREEIDTDTLEDDSGFWISPDSDIYGEAFEYGITF